MSRPFEFDAAVDSARPPWDDAPLRDDLEPRKAGIYSDQGLPLYLD